MSISPALEGELLRWKNVWQAHAELGRGINVTSLLANHADSMFFPNVRDLLKVLEVLSLGSTEAERSFSCVRSVHTHVTEYDVDRQIGRFSRHRHEWPSS